MPIGLPAIEHLSVNYRTHSGIIDVAASIVDILRRCPSNTVAVLIRLPFRPHAGPFSIQAHASWQRPHLHLSCMMLSKQKRHTSRG